MNDYYGRPYSGNREPNADYFDDYMGDNSAPAIFEGGIDKHGGVRDYDDVKYTATPEGVTVSFHCRSCPLPLKLDVTWAELFVVAQAPKTHFLPEGWALSEVNRAPYPAVKCQGCQSLAPIMFTPDWSAKRVDAALRAGLVTPPQLAQDPQVRYVQSLLAQGRTHGGG